MEDTQARGRTWTTDQLQEEFDVLWFSAPYVAVVRKSDLKEGTLQFSHSPRLYFAFREN